MKIKDDPNADRLQKLHPVVDALNAKQQTIPYEHFLSVDKQQCFTKARHYVKQYNPLKLHKWG